jgi:hypothetical protein
LDNGDESVVKRYRSVTLSWRQGRLMVGGNGLCQAQEDIHLPREFPSLLIGDGMII